MDKRHLHATLLALALLGTAAAQSRFTFTDQPWLGALSRAGSGAPTLPNTLTNGLAVYYRNDVVPPPDVIGTNNLTDINPGLIGPFPNSGAAFQFLYAGGSSSGIGLQANDNRTFSPGTNNSFTISFWVSNLGQPWQSSFPAFLDKSDLYAGGNSGWLLQYSSGFKFYIGNGTVINGIVSSVGIPDIAAWYHLTARWNPTNHTQTLGVNGTNTLDSVVTNMIVMTNSQLFSMFCPSTVGSSAYSQAMDEVAIWNRWLSDDEVQQVYVAGINNHVGYPFTQQLTNVFWVMSARGLNETTIQTYFQRDTWVSNHLSITNLIPSISMYVTTNAGWGDTTYGSLAEQIRTNFPSCTGTRTNGFVIFSPGIENDIIVINGSIATNPAFNITNVVFSMSNSAVTLMNRGYKLLAVTCANVVGFSPDEDNWRQYANQWMTNLPGISGFVNVDTFINTNNVPSDYDGSGSEFSEPTGKTNMAAHINAKALEVWP